MNRLVDQTKLATEKRWSEVVGCVTYSMVDQQVLPVDWMYLKAKGNQAYFSGILLEALEK